MSRNDDVYWPFYLTTDDKYVIVIVPATPFYAFYAREQAATFLRGSGYSEITNDPPDNVLYSGLPVINWVSGHSKKEIFPRGLRSITGFQRVEVDDSREGQIETRRSPRDAVWKSMVKRLSWAQFKEGKLPFGSLVEAMLR
jgi:hypothetical protein